MRSFLAWTFYGIGHGIYLVFDRWLPFGMTGWIYGAYSGSMAIAHRIQGDGPGPWGRG